MSAATDRLARAENLLRQLRGTPDEDDAELYVQKAMDLVRQERADVVQPEDEVTW